MKKILFYIFVLVFSLNCSAQTWNFTSVGGADKALMDADAANWYNDTSNGRYNLLTAVNCAAITANSTELDFTKGLLFTGEAAATNTNGKFRLNYKSGRFEMNGSGLVMIIKNQKAGSTITVSCKTTGSAARGFNVTNITPVSGYFNTTTAEAQTNVGKVTTDGDVTLTTNMGGLYVYSLSVVSPENGGNTGGNTSSVTSSVSQDLTKNQMRLTLNTNDILYYNTTSLKSVDIEDNKVTVNPNSGDADTYNGTVANVGFSKASSQGNSGTITNNGVEITESRGWLESAYVKWNLYSGATSYNVYIKGGKMQDYTKLDAELVRNYGTYGRADAVGLMAGERYAIKVVPVISGAEDVTKASDSSGIPVACYDRSGFAHLNNTGVGAYNDDGTLKSDARVLYVTASTAKTVSLDVLTGKTATTYTGLQSIINAYQKGLDTRPLDVRFIGLIKDTDMDGLLSSEGLQVKGKSNTVKMNITIEGIGDDATVWGFGFLLRNAVNVELRNFAIMLCMDDCVSLDTDNKYCWIHHLDLFYGKQGSDADQVKGDGTVDIKGDSKYISVAYNHFFDSGKSSLCGMTSETGPNYIDYNHNWFDHSDSRHPRVRTMTVHVWNNYFDGCAKYGVGATTGSSIFVERNYFRDTKDPMLISQQGTDAKGDGTFSGERGGMIKSFGNVYAEKGSSSNYTPITQKESISSFDCYEATTRNEQVAPTYVALAGGTTYDNFDTNSSLMYNYTPDEAVDVPAKITGWYGAGRLNKGDFKYLFTKTDDVNYSVDVALKTALQNYTGTLVGKF